MKTTIILVLSMALLPTYGSSAQRLAGDDPYAEGNRLYYEDSDFDGALEAYLRVTPESADYAWAERYIGYNIYGRVWGRWAEGIPFLEEAYRVAPSDPKVLEDIGRAYVRVGNELLSRANTAVATRELGGTVQATPTRVAFTTQTATSAQARPQECIGIENDIARLECFDAVFTPEGQATAPDFVGADPGAGPDDSRPNSDRAAAAFDAAARELGPLNVITFEALTEGPFQSSLEVAPGVTVSQTGTTEEGGIVNGCFMDCATDVRRGYNVTPGGEQYLGVPLFFEVGTATVDFAFESPIQSFGTYVIGLGTANGDLSIEFNDGTQRSIAVQGDARGGSQFVGFAAPGASISRVTLALRNVAGGSRDNFSLDDARYTLAN
jgi:hypothetical protein